MLNKKLEIITDEAGNVRVDGRLGSVVEKVKERAIAAAGGGIVIADANQPDMPIVYVNRGFLDITGYDAVDILGNNCRFLQGEETDYEVAGKIREAINNGDEFRGTILNYKKDGTAFWNELSISPVQDDTGEVTHFVGVMLDVTERTELESALNLRVRAVEAANNGIVITDARLLDNPIIYMNKAFEKMTGYSQAEIIGRNCRFLQGADTDPEARTMIRKALQKGTGVRVTIKNYKKDGTPFWNELSISPVRDSRGRLTHFIGVQSDITDLRRTVEENARLLAEVQKAAAQQRVFLRDILASVTEGRLCLDDTKDDLPAHLPLAAEPIALTRQSLRDLRRIVMDVARERDFDDERWQDLVTGIGEAGMNAVVHAGGGIAEVCASESKLQVWIRDDGKGISMDKIHRATLERGFTTAGTLGHGFWLLLKTCDKVHLLTSNKGTTVVIEQELTPPPPSWFTHGTA